MFDDLLSDAAGPRVRRERKTIALMIGIYCKDHHHTETLCEDCQQLLAYAHRRLGTCPFQESKPACDRCVVKCYSPEMRKRITAVMRYVGPRLLLRHPLISLRHLLDILRPPPRIKVTRTRPPKGSAR